MDASLSLSPTRFLLHALSHSRRTLQVLSFINSMPISCVFQCLFFTVLQRRQFYTVTMTMCYIRSVTHPRELFQSFAIENWKWFSNIYTKEMTKQQKCFETFGKKRDNFCHFANKSFAVSIYAWIVLSRNTLLLDVKNWRWPNEWFRPYFGWAFKHRMIIIFVLLD